MNETLFSIMESSGEKYELDLNSPFAYRIFLGKLFNFSET